MTKQELIALAAEGNADIDVQNTMTCYRIGAAPGGEDEIFITLDNGNRELHEDGAYFTDGQRKILLTKNEALTLVDAVITSYPSNW